MTVSDDNPQATLKVTIDGQQVMASPGELIISATDRAGVHVPRFCYHPRMKPVGMCRMCLVEVSGPRGMSLQPACFLPVSDGMEVVTDSDRVKKAQDGVLEFLLINHPLDCPVCDKGGECPLQDQTLAYGPGESRFIERKRHWAKPIELSDLILLDRERCIQCARCTRFAEEVAGDPLIDFMSRGDEIEVNIFPEERFNSYFSGNTVQICPVGALTATPYRFAARPWDLEQVESTCTSCSVGCRVVVQSSADSIIRYLGVDSEPVNRGWLCDKGRFDFEAHKAENRVTNPMIRKDGQLVETSWLEAIGSVASHISEALEKSGPASVGVIGGARLANEDAYAWAKLAKAVIGTDCVDAQLDDGLPAEYLLGLPRASFDDACSAPLVLLAGPDLREEAPILFLRLKEACQSGAIKIVELTTVPSSITPYAASTLIYRPGELPALIGALVSPQAPKAPAAGVTPPTVAGISSDEIERVRQVVTSAQGLVAVVGRASLAESESITAAAVSRIASSIADARFLFVTRRANLLGALDAGLSPGLFPGRIAGSQGSGWFGSTEAWGRVPEESGMRTGEMLDAAASGKLGVLVLLGSDPLADYPDRRRAEGALSDSSGKGCFVVSIGSHLDESARAADVVLPAAMYAERGGTTTNMEGRVSTLGRKVTPVGLAWEDWTIACQIAESLGDDLGFDCIEDICAEMERIVPLYRNVNQHLWSSPASRDGVILPLGSDPIKIRPRLIDPIATPGIGSLPHHPPRPSSNRQDFLPSAGAAGVVPAGAAPAQIKLDIDVSALDVPNVGSLDSYSLRLIAPRRLYDRGTQVAGSEHLSGLAQPGTLHLNHYDLDRMGVSTGDTVRVVSSTGGYQIVVETDDEVPRGVALIGFNLNSSGCRASQLVDMSRPVTDLRLEAL